jgi:hypothetical protein
MSLILVVWEVKVNTLAVVLLPLYRDPIPLTMHSAFIDAL